jgi:hypothetical protein
MTEWVLTCGDESKTLAEWGLRDPMLYVRNMSANELTVKQPGRAFDAEPLFDYGDAVTLIKRERSGTVTTDTVVFRGTRQLAPAEAAGSYEGFDYVFANTWKALEELTFGQRWRMWSVVDAAATSEFIETSEVNLMTEVDPDDGTVSLIHNGDMIRQVIEWAASKGVSIQVGTITPELWLPVDHVRDVKCAEVIQFLLKLCPDAVVEIDDSTTPPTFNCIQRSQMTGRTVALSDEKITQLKLTRRDDLTVPAVVLKYKRTDDIDGRPRHTMPAVDRWPVNATGFEVGAINQTIDLFGGKVETVRGEIVSDELTADLLATKQWWVDHGVAWLGDSEVEDVVVTPAARQLSESVLDEDPEATPLQYVLSPESAGVAKWMKTDANIEAKQWTETFRALVSFRRGVNKYTNHMITLRLKTTNLPSGVYSSLRSAETGEEAVLGLAQAIYNGLVTPHWEGSVTLTEQECGTDIRIVNTLSITGGTGRYATMNAVVQEVVYNLRAGERTLTLGWPKHLSLDDLIEIVRFNRTRRVFQRVDVQGSGEVTDGEDIEFPDGNPIEDAAAGQPGHKVFGVQGGGVSTAGTNNVVKLDGENGLVSLTGVAGAGGSVSVNLGETRGKEIRLREYQVCVGGRTRKVVFLGSDYYD